MSRRLPLILLLLALSLWLGASYGLRFAFMEDPQWVGLCAEDAGRWECLLRTGLGKLIHYRIIAWSGLVTALVGFFLPGRVGWLLALLALLFALPAMVLYSASLAVFAVVIGALRLVRKPLDASL
ncbi:hypothetical protein [Pseudomonas sp. RIT-PI-AD]|uniref:hypothetical protein n=1 Tax=Pseudomonas sp. RIT-PI-AD TaxID=3035294 RepID=UPI0021D8A5BB|nr:hypothetical protein [Pseudomonas sp. RIT-PI-AD]